MPPLPHDILQQLPSDFKAAGIVPYNEDGYWLGQSEKGWSDFGGKRDNQENAWETATRELMEETGIDLRGGTPERHAIFLPLPKYVIFAVKTSTTPRIIQPKFKQVRLFSKWPPTTVELHPRIKFDRGAVLRSEMRSLGF